MKWGASEAAVALLADDRVASMVDRLPLRRGARIVAFGDSLTSDPQSWAVNLRDILTTRRGQDEIPLSIDAVPGETTTQGLVRVGEVAISQPDWVLFLMGTNDARTHGPHPTKTLVHHEETERNIAELRQRIAKETTARCLWITPPAVDEVRVAAHRGLARFGVRVRNADLERVAGTVRGGNAPVLDVFSGWGDPLSSELLMSDGVHLTLAGQTRLAREVIGAWSKLR